MGPFSLAGFRGSIHTSGYRLLKFSSQTVPQLGLQTQFEKININTARAIGTACTVMTIHVNL